MKTKFNIGDWVEATKVVSFGYDYPDETGKRMYKMKRKMFRYGKKVKGIVSGMSYRNIGVRTDGWFNESASFETTKRISVYLIKEGMVNKPYECLEKDLKKIPPEEDFPFFKCFQLPWTEEDREAQSEYASSQIRDSKGRWSKL